MSCGDRKLMILWNRPVARPAVALVTWAAMLVAGTQVAFGQIPSAPSGVRVYAGSPTAPSVTVAVSPANVSLPPGGEVQFASIVTGTTNTSVVWSSTGGTISSAGRYTAGSATGTFRVTATVSGGTAAGSATVTIEPTPTNATIAVSPGQSIQTAIDAVPEGAVILIKAGVHRLQTINPKNEQTIVGEAGSVLSGSRVLTSFSREGSLWVATGQTQQGQVAGECVASRPRCRYPEDLFIDSVRLQHVATLGEVGPGKWYFDYSGDRIYFADDPTARRVETSVTRQAFTGFARDVTIRGLIIERYANPAAIGAIEAAGPGWTVEDSVIRWNHADGIRGGRIIRGNNIHHNGRIGVVSAGVVDFSYNEVAYNNNNGFNPYNEAGGVKFVATNGLHVRHNFAHHNNGPGLWTDIDNINTLYEYNTVEDNEYAGIYHEISFAAVIRYNTVRRNGTAQPNPGWVNGAGIQVDASADVEIYGNTVSGNFQGITGLDSNPGGSGKYILRNLYVHDNDVSMTAGRSGIIQSVGHNGAFTSQNNRWVGNRYTLGANARYFVWMNQDRTETEWRNYGQDVTGVFTR